MTQDNHHHATAASKPAPATKPDETGGRRTIPHEELMQLPVVRYHGPIRLVASDADLHRAVQEIRDEHVVGFDTETRPMFRKGQSYAPSLVQIATSQAVHLFPLARLDC